MLLPTLMTDNPYIFQLIRSLQLHPDVCVVQHGLPWLKDSKYRFDVVHIQWPEVLFKWKEPSNNDFDFIKQKIGEWKSKKTKIISTVHNEFPHKINNKISNEIYKLVYNNSNCIIHLGKESIRLTNNLYGVNSEKHVVIPHGNYTWFENEITKTEARKRLGIEDDRFVMLSFGTIRKLRELKTLKNVAEHLSDFDGLLLVAGNILQISKKSPDYYFVKLPFYSRKNTHIDSNFIPDENVQIYLNAADAIFIPRIKTLNSGNVALGFTFGKVVVGNDYGVVGEELKQTGNAVFDVNDDESLKLAIKKAFDLSKTNQGEKNKIYANDTMNWQAIADKHVEVYKKSEC